MNGLCFGTTSGWNAAFLRREPLLSRCVGLERHTIIQLERLREEDAIVRERTADALLNDTSRDFWTEIKRIRGDKACVGRIVDGLTDTQSIAQMFAAKYHELFRNVPYTQEDMLKVVDTVEAMLID